MPDVVLQNQGHYLHQKLAGHSLLVLPSLLDGPLKKNTFSLHYYKFINAEWLFCVL